MPTKDRRKSAFYWARFGAKYRGIEFKFTFEEWVSWWEEQLDPDWMKLRGCKKGQYVMARFEDVGPYEWGNVKCITHVENYKEYIQRNSRKGERNKRAKITEQEAKIIKRSKKSSAILSKQFGLHRSTIDQIKRGERWSHLS